MNNSSSSQKEKAEKEAITVLNEEQSLLLKKQAGTWAENKRGKGVLAYASDFPWFTTILEKEGIAKRISTPKEVEYYYSPDESNLFLCSNKNLSNPIIRIAKQIYEEQDGGERKICILLTD